MIKWKGKCNQCGGCCTLDFKFMGYNGAEEKKNLIEWALARGYELVQGINGILQFKHINPCPHLDLGRCNIQKDKPKLCSAFPFNIESDGGLDPTLFTPPGCGFYPEEEK